MLDVVRRGMRVREVGTGERGRVVASVRGDRLYVRVQFEGGRVAVFEGTRELERGGEGGRG